MHNRYGIFICIVDLAMMYEMGLEFIRIMILFFLGCLDSVLVMGNIQQLRYILIQTHGHRRLVIWYAIYLLLKYVKLI